MATQIIARQTLAFRINGQSANNRIVVIPPHAVVGSFGDVSFTRDYTDTDVAQYFYPPLPIDFGQFGVSWAVQAYNALANKYNLATVSTDNALIVGVYYVADGNNTTHAKVNNAMLLVNIPIVQQIQTNFDTNFDNLVNSITSLSNLFNTAFNSQNLALQAITTALNNLQINIGDVDISGVDDIVTQLQNLYTINASQNANLTQLSQLANITSAISSQDNQTQIVSMLNKLRGVFTSGQPSSSDTVTDNYKLLQSVIEELRYIFTTQGSKSTIRQVDGGNNISVFKQFVGAENLQNQTNLGRSTLAQTLSRISNKLSSVSDSPLNSDSVINDNKLLYNLKNSIDNIETKLENNLPFSTIVNNDIILSEDIKTDTKITKLESIPFKE